MYSEDLDKIQLLITTKRFDLAQNQLQQLLTQNADDAYLYYLLSSIKYELNLYDQAGDLINSAISLEPDWAFFYYFKACINLASENYTDVENLLNIAIGLDPENSDFKAKLSQFKLLKKEYEIALDIANQALELNPENLLALNTRSTSLLKLNRKEESFATIEGALREDPENTYTHANYGWGLLENGNHQKALIHFRESLRYNPDNSHAQSGMIEALKASNIVYRGYLKYVFFMDKLSEKGQWVFIIGFYVGSKILRILSDKYPNLEPFIMPITIMLAIFAFSTWVITPISNLLFRLNPYGKFLLDRNEKISSSFIGISLLISILGFAIFGITQINGFLPIGIFGFMMMVPFGNLFLTTKIKNLSIYITIILTLLGILSIINAFDTQNIANVFSIIFLVLFVAYQWGINFIVIRKNNI